MNARLLALVVALGLAGFAADAVKTQTLARSATLPSPGFHHVHMNSANPGAAINAYLEVYPASMIEGPSLEAIELVESKE
jgi:hypothetical protein